jgi:hypothetical protein
MPKVVQRDIKIQPKKKSLENDAVASVLLQGMAGKVSKKEVAQVAGVSVTAVREFNRQHQEDIEKQVRANLGEVAVQALQNMVDLAFAAENEHVRFVATKDLLDRAGFKPKSEVDIKQEVIRRDPKEIEAEARKKLGDDLAEKLLGLGSKPEIEDGQWSKA